MIWYLLNILLILVAWYWPISKEITFDTDTLNQIRSKRTCIVGAINWVLLSGLRATSIGADTESYGISFLNADRTSWIELWERFLAKYFYRADVGYKDIGYYVIEKVTRSVTSDYHVWLLIIAIVFTVPMAYFIYKYSSNTCISWIVYSTLFYSFFAITGHRQTIASAIVLWGGLECIRTRKLIPFLLLTAVAYTIHASAICVLPFYWVSRIKVTKTSLWLYMGAIVGAYIFRYQLLAFLQSIVGYESYNQYEGARAGTFVFLLIAMIIVVSIFWQQLSSSNNPILHMSVNAMMLAGFFSPLLTINPSCMRVVQYYSIYIIFLLPEYTHIFDNRSKKVFSGIVCSLMILLFCLQRPQYRFFFF